MVSSISGASLISYYQGQAALGLFGSSGSSSAGASSSALLSSLLAKEGISSSNSSSGSGVTPPTAPWSGANGTPSVKTAVQNAVNGQQIINNWSTHSSKTRQLTKYYYELYIWRRYTYI